MQTTLSPDTDRRFVEAVRAQRLVAPEALGDVVAERDRLEQEGKPVGSFARLLCDRELLSPDLAARVLRDVRAGRAADPGAPRATPAAGRLGSYVLEAELGRGGMGAVFRARHVGTGAVRALKVMTCVPDPETLERFRREADALARVGGEGVVPIHEVGVDRGRVFIVLGLMTGGSLRSRIGDGKRLPWPEAAAVALSLARALARCHAVSLVHRDLKPDNVLFDEDGRAHLGDFGCVRDLGASRLTLTGTSIGTPTYMPIEQLDGRPTDGKADVYALGLLLHEAITGLRPFEGMRSIVDLVLAKRSVGLAPAEKLVPGVPLGLDALIGWALEPDPAARPDAASFADEVEALLEGARDPGERRARRRLATRLVAMLGLALALAGAAGWRVLVARPRERDLALADAEAAIQGSRLALKAPRSGEALRLDDARALLDRARQRLARARELGADARDEDARLEAAALDVAVIDASRAAASGAPEQALALLDAAAKGHELPPEGRLVRGRALAATGRSEEAARVLGDLLEATSGAVRVETGELLGDVLGASGRPADAVKAYTRAIDARSPGSVALHAKRAGAAGLAGQLALARADALLVLPLDARDKLPEARQENDTIAPAAPALYALASATADPSDAASLIDTAYKFADPPAALRAGVAKALHDVIARDEPRVFDAYIDKTRNTDVALLARISHTVFRHWQLLLSVDPTVDPRDCEAAFWRTDGRLEYWIQYVDEALATELLKKLLEDRPDSPALLILITQTTRPIDLLGTVAAAHRALAHYPARIPEQPEAIAEGLRSFTHRLFKLFPDIVRERTSEEELEHLATLAESCDDAQCWLILARLQDLRGHPDRAAKCIESAAHAIATQERPAANLLDLEFEQLRHVEDSGDVERAIALAEAAYRQHSDSDLRGRILADLLERARRYERIETVFPDVRALRDPLTILAVGRAAAQLGHRATAEAARSRLTELGRLDLRAHLDQLLAELH